jgi:hypothetical protein
MPETTSGAHAKVLHILRLVSSTTPTGYWMRAAILLCLLLVLITAASLPVGLLTAENMSLNPVNLIPG